MGKDDHACSRCGSPVVLVRSWARSEVVYTCDPEPERVLVLVSRGGYPVDGLQAHGQIYAQIGACLHPHKCPAK